MWNAKLLSLHVASDLTIFISYLVVSMYLVWICFRYRKQMPFTWLMACFGAFIVACGATHFMDVVVLWSPRYWLAGWLKLLTAIASGATALLLPSLAPRLDALLQSSESSKRNERRFLAASNTSTDAFYILTSERDASGAIIDFRFSFANVIGARLVSQTPEQLQGKLLTVEMPFNVTLGLFARYKQLVESGEPLDHEFRIDEKDVNATWIRVQAVRLEDGVAISAQDITSRKLAELKLRESLAFSRSLVEHSPFAVVAMDLEGRITEINPAATQMLGYSNQEVAGRFMPYLLHEEKQMMEYARELARTYGLSKPPEGMDIFTIKLRRGLQEQREWSLLRKDGSHLFVQQSVAALKDPSGAINGWLIVAYDITERKQAEQLIAHLAHHDALTGLPTRTLLLDRVQVALQHARRGGHKACIMMVDVDNFKQVNDTLGHATGDALLIAVAKRLSETVRESDTVARMGGDEFIVLLDKLQSLSDAERVAQKLVSAMASPLEVAGESIAVTISIGICMFPDGGSGADFLLQNADAAMYFAKAEGRNSYQVYGDEIALQTARRREIRHALEQALDRNEFTLEYQPQVSLGKGEVTGVEALLRWNSHLLGVVSPLEFIPVAEQSGHINTIGEWVLQEACREGKALEETVGRPLIIAVNISPQQFQEDSFPSTVARILQTTGLAPSSLELEITENILVSDSVKAMRVLNRVRGIGLRIAIDDFGTGFSSMSYILRFNVDRLKIDQSFIRNVSTEPNGAITRAIVALARGLKINVVAEGVETEAIADFLVHEGCDEAQGYLYSRPIPAPLLTEFIAALEGARTFH